jgi:hypothetical protein
MLTLRDVPGGGMQWRIRVMGEDVMFLDAEYEYAAKAHVADVLRGRGALAERRPLGPAGAERQVG